MRVSRLLTTTLREVPRDVESGNHELLLRAGYIRQLTAGVYGFMPLGMRVLHKIEAIVREELNRRGAQEQLWPVLSPLEIWQKRPATGRASRAEAMGGELFSLQDRKGRDLALGPTHEEVALLLAKEFMRSYRDLPQMLYQIQVKFRDQLRPRGGLLRTREFLMKDLYSFDANQQGLDNSYSSMVEAYRAIFTRCGLNFILVEADSGAIGGKDSQEFFAPTPAGEDDALVCRQCGYAANREKAEFVREEQAREVETALQDVHTPGCMAISDLTGFLEVPARKTMKVVCYSAASKLVMAVIRGDLEINEVKLTNAIYGCGINAADLHLATPEELAEAGIVAGYTSPLGKGDEVLIIADPSLRQGNNFVAGGNRVDYHIKNVNYPRDFRVDSWQDIASAPEGSQCVRCGGQLRTIRGCELGHIFKIGTLYSDLFDATYLDAEGMAHPILMGSYGIGISRIMAAAVEQLCDERGIVWPLSIAPYQVALLGLDLDKAEVGGKAEQLYADLEQAGVDVLFDDRSESAGVKFNDADLLGLPLRAVMSRRSLKNGGVELKLRTEKESRVVPLGEVVQSIVAEIRQGLI